VTLAPGVFKAYDVRGVYSDEIDEQGGRRVGGAFVAVTGATRVALGHDVRLSSPSMAEAVAEGVLGAGADVVELGLCATSPSATGGWTAASASPPATTRRGTRA
jgi:phosphomannomutase